MIAKRFEEIYADTGGEPVRLSPRAPGLRILQGIRDEAHRFAITYHRTLRDKALTRSFLDDVPGIGSQKKKVLLAAVDVPEKIKGMSREELAAIPGLGDKAALAVFRHYHPDAEP